ncbi:unnamed protein product [Thelazia callipaeda]|uniref:Pecanex-like protein n=1 Tax=Thelazia callipaeda TaxID=103827 RepID=A0A0N5D6E0_THECL|nr:unnamed protein product [Thelazia callipaeda]
MWSDEVAGNLVQELRRRLAEMEHINPLGTDEDDIANANICDAKTEKDEFMEPFSSVHGHSDDDGLNLSVITAL